MYSVGAFNLHRMCLDTYHLNGLTTTQADYKIAKDEYDIKWGFHSVHLGANPSPVV